MGHDAGNTRQNATVPIRALTAAAARVKNLAPSSTRDAFPARLTGYWAVPPVALLIPRRNAAHDANTNSLVTDACDGALCLSHAADYPAGSTGIGGRSHDMRSLSSAAFGTRIRRPRRMVGILPAFA